MPHELAEDLGVLGHDADTVFAEGLVGAPDEELLPRVKAEGRALFTLDKGIADVRRFPPQDHAGLVLFRPATEGRGAVLAFVRRFLPVILAENLPGHLYVVSESGIRYR